MNAGEIQHEDDLLIMNDVARAIEENELVAYFQPVISLSGNRVVSAEALVRWTMPDGIVVPAGLFVPSLDRTDTIFGLDWFMAENVCFFLEHEAAGTTACVPISLNISSRHALDANFAQKLAATVSWHGIERRLIRIELSENVVLGDDGRMKSLMAGVQDAGFTLVMDNFSSDTARLEAARQLDIGAVKVARAVWEARDGRLEKIVARAAELGVELSAEGVESDDELSLLKETGMPCAQGYHIAQPMDAASFVTFCK